MRQVANRSRDPAGHRDSESPNHRESPRQLKTPRRWIANARRSLQSRWTLRGQWTDVTCSKSVRVTLHFVRPPDSSIMPLTPGHFPGRANEPSWCRDSEGAQHGTNAYCSSRLSGNSICFTSLPTCNSHFTQMLGVSMSWATPPADQKSNKQTISFVSPGDTVRQWTSPFPGRRAVRDFFSAVRVPPRRTTSAPESFLTCTV